MVKNNLGDKNNVKGNSPNTYRNILSIAALPGSIRQNGIYTHQLLSKPPQLNPVINLWVKENYLEKTNDHLYNLGTRELGARLMLAQAGKLELEGSIAGKSHVKTKRKNLARKK